MLTPALQLSVLSREFVKASILKPAEPFALHRQLSLLCELLIQPCCLSTIWSLLFCNWHLCNVWTVKYIQYKYDTLINFWCSILFLFSHFPVLHIPPDHSLYFGLTVPVSHFPFLHFQRPQDDNVTPAKGNVVKLLQKCYIWHCLLMFTFIT